MEGDRQTALIDLTRIKKTPIAMFVGTEDPICSHSHAKQAAKEIGDAVVHFESIEGKDHFWFG